MRVHISVCSFLICIILGSLTEADPIWNKLAEDIDNNLILGSDGILEEERDVEKSRLTREYEVFRRGLMMENDDGELVELDLNEHAENTDNIGLTRANLNDRVFFRLYTRRNPVDYQTLLPSDEKSLAASHFNADKPTHFVTHGWVNSANSAACTLIRDAYLKKDDLNVIVVDWSRFTKRPYTWASLHVKKVGKHVAKMIDFLQVHGYLDTDKTALVGHSLGAHVMGLAGYYAKGTINYVVGLDPALPLFVFAGVGERISNVDANHVQIIHTNAGALGYLEAIGHSDFYPNGGSRQQGCYVDATGACSHARSYKFFAESIITDTGFYGKTCSSFLQYTLGQCESNPDVVMGGSLIDYANAGKYYLSTKPLSPFAKGP